MNAFTPMYEAVLGRRFGSFTGSHADGPEADQRVCGEVPIGESSFRLDDLGGGS